MKFFAIAITMLVSAMAWANLPMSPSKFLNINGAKIAVYQSSGHRKPGVLMIHGNTSSAQYYARVMNSEFAREYRVYAIDLPGYGQSDNLPFYSFGLWADTIAKAAKKLGTDKGVLVGWSLGGDLSFQASHLLPKLKGMMVFGTVPVGSDPSLPPAFLSPDQSYAGIAVTYGAVPNLTVQQITDYTTAFFRPNYSPIPSFAVPQGVRTDPNTRQAIANVINGSDTTFQDEVAIVRNMQYPLAIMVGDQDAFLNLDFLEAIAPSIPMLWKHKIITIHNVGHAIQWEVPQIFTGILRHFVQDVQ